jgi:serine/threonine protein kinase
LLASNINAQSGIESNNDPWIIMEHIKGVTLLEFIKTTNPISFRDKLILTIKLLNIIREMHSRKIVHRYINPDNIIVRTQLDTENHHNLHYFDQINLVLISFSRACFSQNDELNQNIILADDCNHIRNTFYQAPQLERQPPTDNSNESQQAKNLQCNPTIDISSICAVLFWLITKCNPKESRNIHGEAPHHLKNHANIIDEEVMRATGKSKNEYSYLDKINAFSFLKEFGQKQKSVFL